MATGTRREREKEEIRRRILDAARDLFALHGRDAVTMRAIADRIEYTPTALYFHFRDKQALLQRLCEEDFGALAARFQVLARVPDPVERIRKIGRAYVSFAVEHPNHYRMIFMTPGPSSPREEAPPDRGAPEAEAYAFLHQAVSEAVAANRFRPEYGDAGLVAQILWAGAHGVASLQIAREGDERIAWRPLEERIDALMDVQLRGLLRG
ncbi:MAG TPA: TetR/AcrR family transcriptional regulator [Candidatus Eisenbacteria bacterium]|nr:TetR/AcrR family transcriptional regulator [Candidatus Eisenbacteria bacterium]